MNIDILTASFMQMPILLEQTSLMQMLKASILKVQI